SAGRSHGRRTACASAAACRATSFLASWSAPSAASRSCFSVRADAAPLSLKHLPRIHQAFGVERVLERAHQLELERILVAADLFALELSQAVLRRDRAAESMQRVVHDAAYLFAPCHQAFGSDVVVEIAVADMTEAIDLN